MSEEIQMELDLRGSELGNDTVKKSGKGQRLTELVVHRALGGLHVNEAINTLILKDRVPGTAAEWLTAITSELKEIESRRLTPLTPEEIAAIPRGTAVRLRMRLVRKKDGRFKARLGFPYWFRVFANLSHGMLGVVTRLLLHLSQSVPSCSCVATNMMLFPP